MVVGANGLRGCEVDRPERVVADTHAAESSFSSSSRPPGKVVGDAK